MTFPESNAYPMMPDKATLKEYGNVAIQNGLTKRELFAKDFMAAAISNNAIYGSRDSDREIAEIALYYTDILIAELNKEVQS
jgi:hypothetical protein